LDKDFHLDETIGAAAAVDALDAVAVASLVRNALDDPDNWEVVAGGDPAGVVLLPPAVDVPVLDPGGSVQVRQQVAPLEVELDKYGEAPISGPSTVHVSRLRLGDGVAAATNVTDWFADGVYWDLGNSERLSAPSFEHHVAGYSLTATDGTVAGVARATVIDHDTDLWEDPTLDLALQPPPPGILGVELVRATTANAFATTTVAASEYTFRDVTYSKVSSQTGGRIGSASSTYAAARRQAGATTIVVPEYEVELP
jgi:hypothetical protein